MQWNLKCVWKILDYFILQNSDIPAASPVCCDDTHWLALVLHHTTTHVHRRRRLKASRDAE